ncbi:hypothetical protein FRX31_011024, partial [Thalictrum thalictroides]
EDAVLREKETKLLHLIDMEFPEDEASSAINACGPDTSIADLIDFIYAARIGQTDDTPLRKPLHQIPDDDEVRLLDMLVFYLDAVNMLSIVTFDSLLSFHNLELAITINLYSPMTP